MEAGYEYSPLQDPGQEIRIIELLPGAFDDDISVKFHHISLKDIQKEPVRGMTLQQVRESLPERWGVIRSTEGKYLFINQVLWTYHWNHPDPSFVFSEHQPREQNRDSAYEALSYVWGTTHKSHSILVNSNGSIRRLAVTENLHVALQHLRYETETRRIWADAVCIDQTNLGELRQQVQRMGDIYKSADRVVVWLGPQGAETKHAMAALKFLGNQVVVEEHNGLLRPAPGAQQMQWYLPEIPVAYTQQCWNDILLFTQRTWFRRAWVVQEVQLAQQRDNGIVMCGRDMMNVSELFRSIYCLYSKRALPYPSFRHQIEHLYMLFSTMEDFSFWDIIRCATIPRQCENSRDKIYAVLGLAPKRFVKKIKVSYDEAYPISQLFQDTFIAHAQHVQRFELFANCFTAGRTICDAPSWVPDWNRVSPGERYYTVQFAAGTSRAHFEYDMDRPRVLKVLGIPCANVTSVSSGTPKMFRGGEAISRLRAWQPQDLDTAIYEPTGEPLRHVYAMTLLQGEVGDRFKHSIFISVEDWTNQDWPEALFGEHAKNELPDDFDPNSDVTRALLNCSERALVKTREGYIGLVPVDTQPGDVICIFLGCSKPILLRPKGTDYIMIGECFIYGLHDCARLLGPLPYPWYVISIPDSGGRENLYFFDPDTEMTTREDPRLEPLVDWERVDKEPDGDDPLHFDFFRHKSTGETISYDPRLEPDNLRGKGIEFTTFCIV